MGEVQDAGGGVTILGLLVQRSVRLVSGVAVVLAVGAVGCVSGPRFHRVPAPLDAAMLYSWLTQQQEVTGLLGNQENDDFSGVYPNAMAAICFIHEGDPARAEKIFQFFDAQLAREYQGPHVGFHQFWSARTGAVHADTDRWIGDNAWLLIALNYYHRETGTKRFETLAQRIASGLISLQDSDGGIFSGYNVAGLMESKSTEGNLDCYAALVDYPRERARVHHWLTNEMWVAETQRFRMGSTVDESALDGSSWSVGALGPSCSGTLAYAEAHFLTTDRSRHTKQELLGFSDFIGKERIWLEGTGQMIVAYKVAGMSSKAERHLTELQKAVIWSRRFKGACGLPCFTSDPDWKGAAEKIFVPAQTWALFALWGFNPMETPDQVGMKEGDRN